MSRICKKPFKQSGYRHFGIYVKYLCNQQFGMQLISSPCCSKENIHMHVAGCSALKEQPLAAAVLFSTFNLNFKPWWKPQCPSKKHEYPITNLYVFVNCILLLFQFVIQMLSTQYSKEKNGEIF